MLEEPGEPSDVNWLYQQFSKQRILVNTTVALCVLVGVLSLIIWYSGILGRRNADFDKRYPMQIDCHATEGEFETDDQFKLYAS